MNGLEEDEKGYDASMHAGVAHLLRSLLLLLLTGQERLLALGLAPLSFIFSSMHFWSNHTGISCSCRLCCCCYCLGCCLHRSGLLTIQPWLHGGDGSLHDLVGCALEVIWLRFIRWWLSNFVRLIAHFSTLDALAPFARCARLAQGWWGLARRNPLGRYPSCSVRRCNHSVLLLMCGC